MLYKTICLRLLEDRPKLYESLRQKRMVLATVDRLATDLKASHQALMEQLAKTRPGSQSSEAMEMAIQELVDSLPDSYEPTE
jgi:hypothetical protein